MPAVSFLLLLAVGTFGLQRAQGAPSCPMGGGDSVADFVNGGSRNVPTDVVGGKVYQRGSGPDLIRLAEQSSEDVVYVPRYLLGKAPEIKPGAIEIIDGKEFVRVRVGSESFGARPVSPGSSRQDISGLDVRYFVEQVGPDGQTIMQSKVRVPASDLANPRELPFVPKDAPRVQAKIDLSLPEGAVNIRTDGVPRSFNSGDRLVYVDQSGSKMTLTADGGGKSTFKGSDGLTYRMEPDGKIQRYSTKKNAWVTEAPVNDVGLLRAQAPAAPVPTPAATPSPAPSSSVGAGPAPAAPKPQSVMASSVGGKPLAAEIVSTGKATAQNAPIYRLSVRAGDKVLSREGIIVPRGDGSGKTKFLYNDGQGVKELNLD